MASTKKPIESFLYAKRYIKNMPLEQVRQELINRVAYYMWMYAPWRWTIGSTPTVTLSNSTQDYTMAYPSDWLYAVRAIQSDGVNSERLLEIVPSLETAVGFVGNPSQISYPAAAGAATGLVRVSPKPGTLIATQTVIGLYKKTMTAFTASTLFTAFLPFDDEWFWVFEEGILWQAYLFSDDRRAGDVVIDSSSGIAKFTGQRAVFEAALTFMKDREKLLLINPFNVDQKDIKK